MEKSIIANPSPPSPYSEEIYQKYLLETTSILRKNLYIDIKSKLLHYLKNISFYYYITVYKNTKINLFNIDIFFCIEFIDGEIPYITILTDFTEPTLNDNRNYYRCLTKEHKYIFNINKYEEQRNILESIINGIENFLLFLNESILLKTFIFFGEYEYKHIYQINDFLQNKNNYFYRINQIFNNEEKERYILFTKLYFILFEPLSYDKSLVKILFCEKLKNMNILFDKNDILKSIILQLSPNNLDDKIEFKFIDRKRPESKDENKENENKKDINKKTIKEKKLNDKNNNEIKIKEKFDYSIFIKNLYICLDSIDFRQFNDVINIYRMIFNEYRGNFNYNTNNINNRKKEDKNLDEFNKLITFYENIVIYYKNKNDKKYNERIHKIISNLIYLCSELINVSKNQNKNDNEYYLKIKKYLTMYK